MRYGPRPEPCDDGVTSNVRYLNRLASPPVVRGARAGRTQTDGRSVSGDPERNTDRRAETVRAAVSAPTPDEALRSIIDMAMDASPWDAAGLVTLDVRGDAHSPMASSPTVGRLDSLQGALNQGPAMDSLREGGRRAVVSENLTTDARWPRWRPAAAAAGVVTVISLRLFTDDTHGALNLYWNRRHVVADGELAEADAVAAQASVVLAYAVSEQTLREKVDRHNALGQAQGILMQRFGVSASGARAVLRSYAEHQDIDVAELARRIASLRSPIPSNGPAARGPATAARPFPSVFEREA